MTFHLRLGTMHAHRAAISTIAPIGALLLVLSLVIAACGGGSGGLGTVPPAPTSPEPSVAQGSPDVTPAPSTDASEEPSEEPSESAGSSPSPSPSGTTIVRAYFWLAGGEGSAGLVAVLREVPSTKAVATAAVNALLAGPIKVESDRGISSAVPDGTQLLGLTVDGGVAVVDLSSEFASGGAGSAYDTRVGQVVYTLTQFPSVKGVSIQIEGQGDSNVLKRSDYVQLLPSIWVDRPAWGASIGNPAHVTGSADVFEATFRISILDSSGKVLADQQVMANCGSGCRGTFDTTIPYTVSKAQYGTLHVYEPSAKDGTPQNIRDYRVWLTP
jgi:Immunoglobulin-like domain of bacterial spore germination/Sporulation and spore germination